MPYLAKSLIHLEKKKKKRIFKYFCGFQIGANGLAEWVFLTYLISLISLFLVPYHRTIGTLVIEIS